MAIVNNKTGYRGYTVDGGGIYPIDSQGRVKRCIVAIKHIYHLHDVACTVSNSGGDFGAQMGDGSIIPLSNPTILYHTNLTTIVQFDMDTPYPSNSPLFLVYRKDSAYIRINEASHEMPFSKNVASGNFGFTVDGQNSDTRGYVNTVIFSFEFPNQRCNVNFEISSDNSHWGARMGDGTVIPLRNPQVLSTNPNTAVVQFTMDTPYPSNSPCILVYRSESAYYRVTPINNSDVFIPIASISGIPSSIIAGNELNLGIAQIDPFDATELDINWRLISGPAILSNDKLTATGPGVIKLKALVPGGGNNRSDYSTEFSITSTKNSISINIQPFEESEPGIELYVSATSTNGNLAYQWYKCDTKSYNGFPISGATSNVFTPVDDGYTKYYYCKLISPGTSDVYSIIVLVKVIIQLSSMSIVCDDSYEIDKRLHPCTVRCIPSEYIPTIRWSSTNEVVAHIDGNGMISPMSNGTVDITAQDIYSGISTRKTITINPFIRVNSIEGISLDMETGLHNLNPIVKPSDASFKDIQWEVVNPGTTCATVTNEVLRLSSSGTLVLRATIINGTEYNINYVQDFVITVTEKFVFVPVTDIQLDGIDLSTEYDTDTIINLNPIVKPSDASFKDIQWEVITGDVFIDRNNITSKTDGNVVIRASIFNGAGTEDHMITFSKDFSISFVKPEEFIPVDDVKIVFVDESGNPTEEYLRSLDELDVELPLVISPSDATYDDIKISLINIESGRYRLGANINNVDEWKTDESTAVTFDPATKMIHIITGKMSMNTLYKVNIQIKILNDVSEEEDFIKDTFFIVEGLSGDAYVPLTNLEFALPSKIRCYYPILIQRYIPTPPLPTAINVDNYKFPDMSFNTYHKDEETNVNAYILNGFTDLPSHTIPPLPIFKWGYPELYLYPQNPGVLTVRVTIPKATVSDINDFDPFNPDIVDFVTDIDLTIEDPFIAVESISNIPRLIPEGSSLILSPEIITGKGLNCENPYWDEDEATYQDVLWSIVNGSAEITEDGKLNCTGCNGEIIIKATIENGVDEYFNWYPYSVLQTEIDKYLAADKDEFGRPFNTELGKYSNPIVDKNGTPPWSYANTRVDYVQEFNIEVVPNIFYFYHILTCTLTNGDVIKINNDADLFNLCNNLPEESIIELIDGTSFMKNEVAKIDFNTYDEIVSVEINQFGRDISENLIEYFVEKLKSIDNDEILDDRVEDIGTRYDKYYDVTIDEIITSSCNNNEFPSDISEVFMIEGNTCTIIDTETPRGSSALKVSYDNAYKRNISASYIYELTHRDDSCCWDNVVLGINTFPYNDRFMLSSTDIDKSSELTIEVSIIGSYFHVDEDNNADVIYANQLLNMMIDHGLNITQRSDNSDEIITPEITSMTVIDGKLIITISFLNVNIGTYEFTLSLPKYSLPNIPNSIVSRYYIKSDTDIVVPDTPDINNTDGENSSIDGNENKGNTEIEPGGESKQEQEFITISYIKSDTDIVVPDTPDINNTDGENSSIDGNENKGNTEIEPGGESNTSLSTHIFRIDVSLELLNNSEVNHNDPIRTFLDGIDRISIPWSMNINSHNNIRTIMTKNMVFNDGDYKELSSNIIDWRICFDPKMSLDDILNYPFIHIIFDSVDPINHTTEEIVSRVIELEVTNFTRDFPEELNLNNFGRNFTSLNEVTNIPPNTTNLQNFLRGCISFNQDVVIPDGVTGPLKNFLRDATSFDSTVYIPEGITGESALQNFLRGCISFNQDVVIPDGVTGRNCLRGFLQDCKSFNRQIIIPRGVNGYACMYEFMSGCVSFNHPIVLPDNLRDQQEPGREMCNFMRSCDSMTSDIEVPELTGINAEVSEQTLSSRKLNSPLSVIGIMITGDGMEEFLLKVTNKYDIESWPYTHFKNLDQ